jgi:outer membrane lipoprotein SlyB
MTGFHGRGLRSPHFSTKYTATMKMKPIQSVLMSAALALATVGTAQAAGCLKGAVVGGVAGHYAGHHAVMGAVGGCIVGHHLAKERARQQAEQRAQLHAAAQPN